MITTIIIDDEVKASENLKILLESFCPDVEIIGIYNNVVEAIKGINALHPQLLFLDVQMPIMDGFSVLDSLKDKSVKVVFTTAHSDFALNAIKVNAIDYLLKPIVIPDLVKAVAKVAENLSHTFRNETEKLPLLKVPTLTGFDIIKTSDIFYLKSSNNYTEISYLNADKQKKIISSKTLKYFEEVLDEKLFFRPHDSYIINLNKVAKYNKGEGGTIELFDGTTIDVSRRKKQDFLKIFEGK